MSAAARNRDARYCVTISSDSLDDDDGGSVFRIIRSSFAVLIDNPMALNGHPDFSNEVKVDSGLRPAS